MHYVIVLSPGKYSFHSWAEETFVVLLVLTAVSQWIQHAEKMAHRVEVQHDR